MKKAIITVKNLRKVYKLGRERVVALDDVSVRIMEGEVCCILGTSGSGKSTLLNMLAGLEKPTRGQVLIGKRDVARMNESALAKFRQKHIGFVFQSYNLLESLTAEENVSMPLMFRGVDHKTRTRAARKMLKDVGLGNRYDHRPSQMSGGQQQRVGIARAFVSHPRIVFADEPTGNLDTKTTIEVMELMVQMCRDHNQTLIVVTHDPEIAQYADRVVRLIDGNIVSDLVRDPETGKMVPMSPEEGREAVDVPEDDGGLSEAEAAVAAAREAAEQEARAELEGEQQPGEPGKGPPGEEIPAGNEHGPAEESRTAAAVPPQDSSEVKE